ncbi:MAG: 30S ribosomal protein S9 [candidate division Zixibacteria bacterium]|nr:30S ribosomal protein S9 [candidate division Zixibacteria bacterium]
MTDNKFAATGRRKESTARVTISQGKGSFIINKKKARDYLLRDTVLQYASEPLEALEMAGQLDIVCTTSGGGLSGQAGAIRLGIARALILLDPELRPALKKEGFLTRDPRAVERKKYGQPKARKKFQYSKR